LKIYFNYFNQSMLHGICIGLQFLHAARLLCATGSDRHKPYWHCEQFCFESTAKSILPHIIRHNTRDIK